MITWSYVMQSRRGGILLATRTNTCKNLAAKESEGVDHLISKQSQQRNNSRAAGPRRTTRTPPLLLQLLPAHAKRRAERLQALSLAAKRHVLGIRDEKLGAHGSLENLKRS